MESQPQNPEFRNNPENFHQCIYDMVTDECGLLFIIASEQLKFI